MKKSKKTVSKTISVSPEAAWHVIGAVGGVDKWFAPLIQTCKVEGNKRYCSTAGGLLEEDVLEVNHEDRIFRYGIPEQPIMPVENIFGTMKVLESENNQATIEWTAEFEVQSEKEAEAKQMFEEAYSMGIQGIENYILSQEVVQS